MVHPSKLYRISLNLPQENWQNLLDPPCRFSNHVHLWECGLHKLQQVRKSDYNLKFQLTCKSCCVKFCLETSNTFATSFGSQRPRLGSDNIPKNSGGVRDSGLSPEARIFWSRIGSLHEMPRSKAHRVKSFWNLSGSFSNNSARFTENPERKV